MARAMLAARVTRTMLTPSIAALLLAADSPVGRVAESLGVFATLRVTVLCGELASTSLVRSLLAAHTRPGAKLANLYSISEAHDVALEPDLAVAVKALDVLTSPTSKSGSFIPCGSPYSHVNILIADDEGKRLTSPDTPGWLHIG